jgi:hypothetical protein
MEARAKPFGVASAGLRRASLALLPSFGEIIIMHKNVFKPTGLVPRSIPRTVRRFFQQLQPESEQKALEEFRVSRYQAIVSVQCLLVLLCVPLLVAWPLKVICIRPCVEHVWNAQKQPLFLNAWQEHRAFLQLQEYTDQRFFDHFLLEERTNQSLIQPSTPADPTKRRRLLEKVAIEEDLQGEFIHVANTFNTESVTTLTNILSDLSYVGVFLLLYHSLKAQRAILKTFITETLYSFSDTTKAFLVLLMTDLLVGYHSPIGWELSLETLIQHFGFAPNEDFVFLIVATVPVFLSTVFKYGIFRYLNRVSPSTVAIYHNMIE